MRNISVHQLLSTRAHFTNIWGVSTHCHPIAMNTSRSDPSEKESRQKLLLEEKHLKTQIHYAFRGHPDNLEQIRLGLTGFSLPTSFLIPGNIGKEIKVDLDSMTINGNAMDSKNLSRFERATLRRLKGWLIKQLVVPLQARIKTFPLEEEGTLELTQEEYGDYKVRSKIPLYVLGKMDELDKRMMNLGLGKSDAESHEKMEKEIKDLRVNLQTELNERIQEIVTAEERFRNMLKGQTWLDEKKVKKGVGDRKIDPGRLDAEAFKKALGFSLNWMKMDSCRIQRYLCLEQRLNNLPPAVCAALLVYVQNQFGKVARNSGHAATKGNDRTNDEGDAYEHMMNLECFLTKLKYRAEGGMVSLPHPGMYDDNYQWAHPRRCETVEETERRHSLYVLNILKKREQFAPCATEGGHKERDHLLTQMSLSTADTEQVAQKWHILQRIAVQQLRLLKTHFEAMVTEGEQTDNEQMRQHALAALGKNGTYSPNTIETELNNWEKEFSTLSQYMKSNFLFRNFLDFGNYVAFNQGEFISYHD